MVSDESGEARAASVRVAQTTDDTRHTATSTRNGPRCKKGGSRKGFGQWLDPSDGSAQGASNSEKVEEVPAFRKREIGNSSRSSEACEMQSCCWSCAVRTECQEMRARFHSEDGAHAKANSGAPSERSDIGSTRSHAATAEEEKAKNRE